MHQLFSDGNIGAKPKLQPMPVQNISKYHINYINGIVNTRNVS